MLKNDQLQERQRLDQPDPSKAGETPKHYQPPDIKSPSPRGLGIGILVALVVAGIVTVVAVVWVVHYFHAASAKKAAAAHSGPPAVPVIEGKVVQKDVPIYVDGLGTVQAFNTVTVHVRVDGELKKVAFVEGQDVHAGDLLAQIDPDPFRTALEQTVAKKGQDEAQLANAQLDLKRDADLFAQKIATQQTYDTQKALVDQLAAAVKADQAAIDSAKVQLDYTTVTSPLDGRTGIRQVDQGNIVHAADVNGLVVITQLHPISVVFTLPEQALNEIQKEMSSNDITILAVDRDNITQLGEGKLAVVDNEIDTTTGTIRLKATFANDDLRLWPGQFVNARLLLATRKGGLTVPASAVQRGPNGSYIFVIKDDQSVEVRPVKVGQIEKGEALIDEGLNPNERIVVDGQYRLQIGSHVKPAPAAKTATAAAPES
jgi:multidrug efflux system membrane fusion protein